MRAKIIIFAYEHGKMQLKVLCKDGKIPHLFIDESYGEVSDVKDWLIQNLNIKYDWAFHSKNFHDIGCITLLYIFFLPEKTPLKDFHWVEIMDLNEEDKLLLDEARKHI